MYHYISYFVTEAAHLKIVTELQKYTVQVTPMGELLFKLMTQKAVIDTRATDYHLREKSTTWKPTPHCNLKY